MKKFLLLLAFIPSLSFATNSINPPISDAIGYTDISGVPKYAALASNCDLTTGTLNCSTITHGAGIAITGAGTTTSPYLISATGGGGGAPIFAVYASDYGADNTGTSDNVTAFTNAEAALPSEGGQIYVSNSGGCTYKFGANVAFTKPTIINWQGCTIKDTSATASIFSLSANNSSFEHFYMTSTVTPTAGSFFVVNGGVDINISHGYTDKYYLVATVDNTNNFRYSHMYGDTPTPASTSAGGGVLKMGATTANLGYHIEDIYYTATTGNMPSYGIQISQADTGFITNASVILHGDDIKVNPGTGQAVRLLFLDNDNLDTATNGLDVVPTGTGNVSFITITGGWVSVQTNAGILLNQTAGTIADITVNGVDVTNNTTGIKTIGAVSNLIVDASTIISNTTGLNIDTGTTGTLGGSNILTNTTDITSASTAFNGAWYSYTPTVTANTGTFTSVSGVGAYKISGGMMDYSITVTITTNGTAAGDVEATLPKTPLGNCTGVGRETGATGKQLQTLAVSNRETIWYYDGTYPGANGHVLTISGRCRVQ